MAYCQSERLCGPTPPPERGVYDGRLREKAHIGKKAGNRKTANEVEVVDADVPAFATEAAVCEAEHRAWESALRENKGHKTVYPFVIPLVDGELV